jgi:hypothetical protein
MSLIPEPPPVVAPPPVAPPVAKKTSPAVWILLAVLGIAFLGFVLIVVAAIAIPGLLRARMTGNETSAIERLNSIASAQVAFSAACGNGGYADSFSTLAAPDPTRGAVASPDVANLAGSPEQAGFVFAMSAGAGAVEGPKDCHGKPTRTKWYATAEPQTFGTSGARSFAVNSSLTIWYVPSSAAPTEPFGPPASRIAR